MNSSDSSVAPSSPHSQSWLQHQQEKLRNKQDNAIRSERQPKEDRLLSELQSVQQKRQLKSTAKTEDGYFSDMISDREPSPKPDHYSTPLHVNTSSYTTYNSAIKVDNGLPEVNSSRHSAPSSPMLLRSHIAREQNNNYFSESEMTPNGSSRNMLGRHSSDILHNRNRPFIKRKSFENRLKEEYQVSFW